MAKTKQRDLSVICRHCGEPMGLHAAIGLTCPAIERGHNDYEDRGTRFEPVRPSVSRGDCSK